MGVCMFCVYEMILTDSAASKPVVSSAGHNQFSLAVLIYKAAEFKMRQIEPSTQLLDFFDLMWRM